MDLSTIYTPQSMVEAMEQKARPLTFLQGLFIKGIKTHTTPVVSIDVVKGGRKVAAYINRTENPGKVAKRGYSTQLHVAPYVAEEIDYTAENVILERLPGENPINGGSPRARQDALVMGWLNDLQDRLINLQEFQVAEALQTGKLHVIGAAVDYYVDFQMDSNNLITLTGGDKWDSTGNKISQLQAWCKKPRAVGAPSSTLAIMGENAANLFLADANVLKYLDNRKMEMGSINPVQLAEQNATFLGTFRYAGINLDLYSYQGQYTNAGGSVVNFIDTNNVIVGSQAADLRMHYGPIFNLKHGTFVGEKFPHIYVEESGRQGHVALESSPMFGFHQPDAFVRATVA